MMYHSGVYIFNGDISEFAGYLKVLNIPFPELLAPIAIFSEFLGGLSIILNIRTRISALLIIIVMSVAHYGLILTDGGLAFSYLLMTLILFFNPWIPFGLVKKFKLQEDVAL